MVANQLLGDITLSAGNSLGIRNTHSPDALRGRFEANKERYVGALDVVATQYLEGRLSDDALRAASVPSKPLPMRAVQALAALKQDPAAYQAYLQSLGTGSALLQLTADCNELEAKLTQGMNTSSSLGKQEREAMEQQLRAMRLGLAGLMAEAEVTTKYYEPAVQALMGSYTAMMNQATAVGMTAPAVTVPVQRYGRQSPYGYAR